VKDVRGDPTRKSTPAMNDKTKKIPQLGGEPFARKGGARSAGSWERSTSLEEREAKLWRLSGVAENAS